ncbi:hypothetical protein PGTUg99_007537 [Puccinia graminis f. sp. tritici]|uniref:Uncharacterized protein n=1 Tax=Puccinia graminis f. sp. tritici TaxID=56615 RepID=A0A5B0QLC8_PUCGR|nr:hypothetical protein PGTUg99_007537 [Puccinia graminis f. sp. tritici]
MADAVSLCHLPSSFDYSAPSYPSHLQPATLTELDTRGETPSGCKHAEVIPSLEFLLDESNCSSQSSVEEAGLTSEPSANISRHTIHVISNSPDSGSQTSSLDSSSPQPLRCITATPLTASRADSCEIPSHLGSPVALTDPEGSAAGSSFPLLCSSPIQETFDLTAERPLVSNRRSRWLSTGNCSPATQELGLEFESMEHALSTMPGFKGHHASKSTTTTTTTATTTTTGSRLKQGDPSLSRLKSTMFSSMNKSEPNLANPEGGRSLPAYDILPGSRTSGHPKNLRPSQQLSLSSGKAGHTDVVEIPRSLQSGNHPSIRSIFNQTSRRISEFTSRLNGPNHSSQGSLPSGPSPPECMPPALRSPVIVIDSQHNGTQLNPDDLPRVSLAPLQRTPHHHQEELPDISQTSPHADNPQISNKVKRSNARVHSPNFYQSLKSRWKPDSLPAQDLFANISTVPSTSRNPPKTYSNFDKMKLEHENQDFLSESQAANISDDFLKGSSEGKDAGSSAHPDSGLTGELSLRAAHATPASRLRAFSTSSHKSDLASIPPVHPTEKQQSQAVSASEDNPPTVVPSDAEHTADGVMPTVSTVGSNQRNPSPGFGGEKSAEGIPTTCSIEADVPRIPVPQPLLQDSRGFARQHAFSEPPKRLLPKLPSTATKLARNGAECENPQPKTLLMPSAEESSPILHDGPSMLNAAQPGASTPDPNDGLLQCSAVSTSRQTPINQIKAPTTEVAKPESMTIAEGLHHKHHLNFAARRSSISMVLKRPDSLDASTPIIFQGIWERELEENERKWKRLARMSGSQSSSRYSTESYSEKDNTNQTHGERAPFITGGSLRHSSSRTSQHLIRLGRKLSQNKADHHTKSQSQSDVLDQVWDSFKCEAELSLSDINCDRSIIDDSSSSPGCPNDLPGLHEITLNDHFERAHAAEDSESLARQDSKPIGLGLFHPCDPPIGATFPIQDEYSPITNAKLKKLSLLSTRASWGTSDGSRERRRRPESKATVDLPDTNYFERNPTSLDLSLLDAFPAPPRSHRSSQSSSSSHSLKALKSTDMPRKNPRDGAKTPTAQAPEATNERRSPERKVASSVQRQKSTEENSRKSPISFVLTSFSNRPRAQTSVRSPVPPPLNLNSAPSSNTNHRRRTMTSHMSNPGNSGTETIPPVPFLRVPNTAPLASTTAMSHDRDKAAGGALSPDITRPNLSNEIKSSKIGTGGLTPKRPSLLIRPSLRSPHRAGIRMAPFRSGETSLSPKLPAAYSPGILSPTVRPIPHSIQQTTNGLNHSIEQAGYFSSPHASVGSSTGTASTSSTVPSPATPTSLGMAYNSRIPSVPMYHASNFTSGLRSPIKSTHPDNPRYVMIDQTPKYSAGARGPPETIKATRVYRPELLNSSPLAESTEQVSYGMAL